MTEFNDWLRFERWAQKNGGGAFLAMLPNGKLLKGEWLDAHMGLVKFEGVDGFVTVDDLDEACPAAHCIVLE